MIRSAVRGLLAVTAVADAELAAQLRAALSSGDGYVGSGKPQIDWDDRSAREESIDSRLGDAYTLLALLDGRELAEPVIEAATLLATVLGQDLEQGSNQVFRIARRVARDRVISTVDPEAQHGHKTAARGFDGYKGHAAVDPDSEIITATTVTQATPGTPASPRTSSPTCSITTRTTPRTTRPNRRPSRRRPGQRGSGRGRRGAVRVGDNAYGAGEFHDRLQRAGTTDRCKTQTPTAAGGLFSKDRFDIDLGADTVSCPGGPPPRSIRPTLAAAPPTPGPPAPTARCAPSAPPPPAGARARSAPTSRPSPTPELDRPTPPGSPTIADPTQGRTQARALMRRKHGGRRVESRHRPCRCRLPDAGRRDQSGADGRARVRATTYGWVVAASPAGTESEPGAQRRPAADNPARNGSAEPHPTTEHDPAGARTADPPSRADTPISRSTPVT